jgi:hemolysin activation/secretion protein
MRFLALFLCLLPAPLEAAPPRKARLPAGLVIASIRIEAHNIFDTDAPPENKLFYRLANRAHIRTFDAVVERELLFAAGEPLNPHLIEETERNLRALPFIRRAEITTTVNARGTVDVVVRTYDSWSLEVVASYKRAGGSTSVKAGLAENNILGQGKAVSAVYAKDGDAQSRSFAYKDAQFLRHKRLQYAITANSAPGSRQFGMSLNRPFYASIARRSAGASVSYGETNVGPEKRKVGEAGASYGVAFATSTSRTRRVTFGVLSRRSETTGPVRDLEQLNFLKVGLEWQELDFLVARRIQNFTRDEDFNLGLGVFPSVAWAPRAAGSTSTQILPRVDAAKGFAWTNSMLLLKSGYGSKYVNGNNGNRIASVDASFFLREFRFQTWALHTAYDLGWQLDSTGQLSLGELNGLRGYGLSEFTGTRRFLYNLEDRVYVYDDLFRLLDVGSVFFFDSGYAWPDGHSMKVADLKNSVGFGLRVAPSRSGSNSPVRVDLAYPLNRQSGRARWSLSILAGQAF